MFAGTRNTTKKEGSSSYRKHMMGFRTDLRGLVLLALTPLVALGVYFFRVQARDFRLSAPFDEFLLIVLVPLLAILVATVLFYVVFLVRYVITEKGRILPLPILVGLVTLALLMPLPPTFEENFFFAHRSAYESIVEQARAEQLRPTSRCPGSAFEIPAQFGHIAVGCVYKEGSLSLGVAITPQSYYRRLVYVDDPAQVGDYALCSGTSQIYKRIDAHWFLCHENAMD